MGRQANVLLNLGFFVFFAFASSAAACDKGKEWQLMLTKQVEGTSAMFVAGSKFLIEEHAAECEILQPNDVIGSRTFSDPSLRAFNKVESVGLVCRFDTGRYISLVATYFRVKGETRGVTNPINFVLGDIADKKKIFNLELTCRKS